MSAAPGTGEGARAPSPGRPARTVPGTGPGFLHRARATLEAVGRGLTEFYVAPYRRTFARARRDEEDLLRLVVLAESLGVPDPARWYTLELLPVLYEDVHEWHRRIGLDRSPLEHVTCC